MNIKIEIAEETAKLVQQDGTLTFTAALRQAKEMYKKELSATDQSKQIELTDKFNDIIPHGTDIDNSEIFDIASGNTIRDL
jgi:hypothetical protein